MGRPFVKGFPVYSNFTKVDTCAVMSLVLCQMELVGLL